MTIGKVPVKSDRSIRIASLSVFATMTAFGLNDTALLPLSEKAMVPRLTITILPESESAELTAA